MKRVCIVLIVIVLTLPNSVCARFFFQQESTTANNGTAIKTENTAQAAKPTASVENMSPKPAAFVTPNVRVTYPSKQPRSSNEEFSKELDLIKQDLEEQQFSAAILTLTEMLERLRTLQKQHIEPFFPVRFMDYEVWDEGYQSSPESVGTEAYGVLFTRRYRNPKDYTIDVNVVYSNDSIREYRNLIRSPQLIESLENTRLIKILNQYDALEKYSKEQKFCERNILVNEDLLLNIVFIGFSNRAVIDNFTQAIKIQELTNYLDK